MYQIEYQNYEQMYLRLIGQMMLPFYESIDNCTFKEEERTYIRVNPNTAPSITLINLNGKDKLAPQKYNALTSLNMSGFNDILNNYYPIVSHLIHNDDFFGDDIEFLQVKNYSSNLGYTHNAYQYITKVRIYNLFIFLRNYKNIPYNSFILTKMNYNKKIVKKLIDNIPLKNKLNKQYNLVVQKLNLPLNDDSDFKNQFDNLDFSTPETIYMKDTETLTEYTLKLESFMQRMKYAYNYINSLNDNHSFCSEGTEPNSNINSDLTKGFYINAISTDGSYYIKYGKNRGRVNELFKSMSKHKFCKRPLFPAYIFVGDWVCGKCNNCNFNYRDVCAKCEKNKNYQDLFMI